MLLRVGELAKKAGLTVRTLHHYDSIGLLCPSARSDAGYRLYNREDIARLHAVQALRQIGMPLCDIAEILTRPEQSLSTVVRQQIAVLDRQIAQATELRKQLQLLDARLDNGDEPELGDWLSMLELMSAYGKYFTPKQLKRIFGNWRQVESEWSILLKDVEEHRRRSIDPTSLDLQPLAWRWMELTKRWMNADFDLILKWRLMYESEPIVSSEGAASSELFAYIKPAIDMRLAAMQRYFTNDELMGFQERLHEWDGLENDIQSAIRAPLPPDHEQAVVLLRTFDELMDHTVNHDPALRVRLMTAFAEDDVLRAGSPLSESARQYLQLIMSMHDTQ